METLTVRSPAFEEGQMIPPRFTADGADVSPPLEWSKVPPDTASMAVIADDPDAPMGTWVHWVIYNLPPETDSLPADVPPVETLNNGAAHGTTDFGRIGYGGPAPPSGVHRYFFRVYALDIRLDLPAGATRHEVDRAMRGHILAQGELMGRYSRR